MLSGQLFDQYKGKKVFITGNTGFKGSWCSIWLKELGAEVYGYALPPKHKEDNFSVCGLEDKIHQTYGDVTDFNKLNETVKSVNPDIILHLAAQALVIDSYHDPIRTYQTNVMGVVNIMQAARGASNLKSLVVITSDKCYENKEIVWGYRENDELGGSDPYSSSKACAEIAIQSFRKSFFQDTPIALISVRAGNVIGGGDWSANRLIPDIFKAQRSSKAFEIRSPKATRPWEHVLEPLSGYLQLAISSLDSKRYEGSWNFGPSTYTHYSVLDVVEQINKQVPLNYKVNTPKGQFKEANLLKLDITKAANDLKWLPQLNFEETIRFTVEGYMVQDDPAIYAKRVAQIEEYTKIASANKITWTL